MFKDKDIVTLIIDDDTWMQRVLSKIFNRLEIFKVHSAEDGFSGINSVIENNPDIIFLDLIMPGIDGFLTLKILKAINITKNIPVVIVTSNSDFENIATVLSAGATDFIAKPFSSATIQEKLTKILSDEENKKKLTNTSNNSGLNTDSDNADFLNSFTLEIINEFDDNGIDERETNTRMSYKNIANTYKETPEAEINKILKK